MIKSLFKSFIIIYIYFIAFFLFGLSLKFNIYTDFLEYNKNTFIVVSQMTTTEYTDYLEKKIAYEELTAISKTRITFLEHACLSYGYQATDIIIYTDAEKRFCNEYREKLSLYDILYIILTFRDSQILESDIYKDSLTEILTETSENKKHEGLKSNITSLLLNSSIPDFPDYLEPSCTITDSKVGCSVSFQKRNIRDLEFIMNISINQHEHIVSCTDESEMTNCFIDSTKPYLKVKEFLSKTKNIDPSLSNSQFMIKFQNSL